MDISSSDPVPATEQFRRVSGQGGGLLGGRLAIDAPAVILPVVFGSLTAWAPDDLGARPSGPPKRRCRRRQPCRRLGQRVEPTTIWSRRSSSFAAIANGGVAVLPIRDGDNYSGGRQRSQAHRGGDLRCGPQQAASPG